MAEEKETCETSDKINIIAEHEDYPTPRTSKALQLEEKPKLIQESSWTRTVPYTHWHSYVKPTDSIGSSYVPSIHRYRTRSFAKRGVKPAQWHPFGDDSILKDPPRVFIEQYNKEVERRMAAAAEKRRDSLPENIVSLKDLVDDTWLRKKRQKTKMLKKKLSVRKERITKRDSDREVT